MTRVSQVLFCGVSSLIPNRCMELTRLTRTDAMNEVAWCYLEGFGCKKDKVSIFRLSLFSHLLRSVVCLPLDRGLRPIPGKTQAL